MAVAAAAELDAIVNQSFLEEQARFNKKKIKTGESGNVAILFKEVQLIKTECNICYDDSAACIQCYQCDFKYCQECLGKVISEFNKCSACQANFKDNYEQLKTKNKKKKAPPPPQRPQLQPAPSRQKSIAKNTKPQGKAIANLANEYEDLLLSDYEIEQIAFLTQMESLNISNTKTSATSKKQNQSQINNNRQNNNANADANQRYLDNDFGEDVEPCQFQTVMPNAEYAFNVKLDRINNHLIYTTIRYNLYPIILNYKLLDKYFQRCIFFNLVELLNKPKIFINVWQNISAMLDSFYCNYNYIIELNEFNNPEFIYKKQDLLNTITQMVSY